MTRPGTTIQLQASIPKELMAELKTEATRQGRSLSNLVAFLLAKAVAKEGK